MYGKSKFKCVSKDKMEKEGKVKDCKCPTEYAAEATVDLNKENKFAGKVGTRVKCGDNFSVQAKIDSHWLLSGALTYVPVKGYKLSWSDQVNAKNLFTNPRGDLEYKYGFTIAVNF